MHSFSAFIKVSLAFVGLATAGCLGSEETASSPYLLEDMPMETADVGGSSGTNSLLVSSYLGEYDSLLDITSWRLKHISPPGTHTINFLVAHIVGTPAGQELFTYATRCALGASDYILAGASPTLTYPGSGILTTTTGWGFAGLTTAQKEDLFTCVITHLNPSGNEVDIYLKGPSVAADASDGTAFDFDEAVWVTTINTSPLTGPVIQHHVWPQQDMRSACGPSLEGSLGTRVCGGPEGCANLIIHTDAHFAANCTGSNDSYTCLGRPAIHTKLKTIQLHGIHPKCT